MSEGTIKRKTDRGFGFISDTGTQAQNVRPL